MPGCREVKFHTNGRVSVSASLTHAFSSQIVYCTCILTIGLVLASNASVGDKCTNLHLNKQFRELDKDRFGVTE